MYPPYILGKIKKLQNKSKSVKAGHTTYNIDYALSKEDVIPLFYKINKHNNPQASVNEVAFSELARLFMLPDSTPIHHLMQDKEGGEITGVASHHVQLSIAKRENISATQFMNINFSAESRKYLIEPMMVNTSSEIPYKFLNDMPHGFFAYLMKQRNDDQISIDMDSLASVLVGKYTLEEDDLHKANFGFYITLKENKPHVSFFSIDHDLLLTGSLISHFDSRISSWGNVESAFNITALDLLWFPDLQDSKNHYWPTRKRFMVPYGDDKVYADPAERAAFRDLKYDREFNLAKWKRLLKSAFVPNALIHTALALHLDQRNPESAAQISLIGQAMTERLMQLRATLFSIPEFRYYVNSDIGRNDILSVQRELTDYIKEILPFCDKDGRDLEASLLQEVHDLTDSCLNYCNSQNINAVQEGDSPLHIAIRIGQYRFEQSQKAFGQYVTSINGRHQQPIDIAAELAEHYKPGSEKTNPSKDPFAVIKHLLSQGSEMTPKVRRLLKSRNIDIANYHFHSRYYDEKVTNYAELKAVMTEIGKDNDLSLKTKKIITEKVVKQHIHLLTPKECEQFKLDLNGSAQKPIAPEFLFISQLRSSLWIVRAIRGLYGLSSTRMELNSMINQQVNTLKSEHSFQFFSLNCSVRSSSKKFSSKEDKLEPSTKKSKNIH